MTVFLALLEYALVNYKYYSKRSKLVKREIIHHMKRIEGLWSKKILRKIIACSRFCDHQKAMKAMSKDSELPHVTGCHAASPLSCTMVSKTFPFT